MILCLMTKRDKNRIVYEDENWQIQEHCDRGYLPWFTLHKRRHFLKWSWWSSMQQWSIRYDSLSDFIDRWNGF